MKIIELQTVDSTNIFAKNIINTESATFSHFDNYCISHLIIARQQSAGKGQVGNIWESEADKNLLISYIASLNMLSADKQFYISMASCLAIISAIKNLNTNFKIKWPNDIYFENKKLGGILIENILHGFNIYKTIIGIGLNINQKQFSTNLPNPVSLFQICNQEFDKNLILNQLTINLNKYLIKVVANEFDCLKTEYIENLYLFNKISNFKTKSEIIEGKIIDIEDFGYLVIETSNRKILKFAFKEVDFI